MDLPIINTKCSEEVQDIMSYVIEIGLLDVVHPLRRMAPSRALKAGFSSVHITALF
jgi:hypothetical protein